MLAALALLLVCAITPGLVIVARCAMATATPRDRAAGTRHPAASAIDGYSRAGSATYLTLPEWLIVYDTEEYAAFISRARPSGFAYLRSIVDFWRDYSRVCAVSCGAFPFDVGDHVMIVVIGSSFAVENILKGLYENVVGRAFELVSGHDTEEDAFAARVAAEYGHFMHTVPWYEFPFGRKLAALWRETPLWGRHPLRKWERRIALSSEYALKGSYGWLIRAATKATYGDENPKTYVRAAKVPAELDGLPVERVRPLENGEEILAFERYEKFTPAAAALAARGMRFVDIAGNTRVLVTVIAAPGTRWSDAAARALFSQSLATDPPRERLALDVDVTALGRLIAALPGQGVSLEHIYDF